MRMRVASGMPVVMSPPPHPPKESMQAVGCGNVGSYHTTPLPSPHGACTMNTLLKTASTSTILAIDLGKYKSVACLYDQDTRKFLSLVMLYESDPVPRERSRRRRRHPTGIELAALLGLHLARRGFWDAIF